MKKLARVALVLAVLVTAFGASRSAFAGDDTIKHPGDHPMYKVEIEPHLLLGYTGFYGGTGYGIGGRFSIPIVDNGFISTINNSIAISFGVDFVHYDACYFYDARFGNLGCGANYLFFPVVMQWNFFVAQKWSVFGEPGVLIYHGFFDNYCDARFNGFGCSTPTTTGVTFAGYIGGRYHFSEHVALTMRLGYPTLSVGVSFM